MKEFLIALIVTIIIFLLFKFSFSFPDYPMLRERFGTILHHSSDKDGVYMGSYNDPTAVDHIYCYYPKAAANSKLLIKRQDNGDCNDWY